MATQNTLASKKESAQSRSRVNNDLGISMSTGNNQNSSQKKDRNQTNLLFLSPKQVNRVEIVEDDKNGNKKTKIEAVSTLKKAISDYSQKLSKS